MYLSIDIRAKYEARWPGSEYVQHNKTHFIILPKPSRGVGCWGSER